MSDATYDSMAAHQHLIFADWPAALAWQGRTLGALLERECGPGPLRLLDCACGIGTQALGLAARGHRVTASDLSAAAVDRARLEAAARGLDIDFHVADMRSLENLPDAAFDAVLAFDNALPHLENSQDLLAAARSMMRKLRPGGLLAASIRDYDAILETRPSTDAPRFFSDDGRRRIVHQVWDWLDQRRYRFHLYITRETAAGWESLHFTGAYRALTRDELSGILRAAGFAAVRWLQPGDSGFYQPVVLARQ